MQKHLEEFRQSEIVGALTDDSICIDCGANVGEITAIMAEKGARVYAFEPNPAAYSRLAERFAHDDKIVCCPNAVSDKSGTARLYFYKYADDDQLFWSQGASICGDKDDIDRDHYVDVELVNLIDFIRSIDGPIDILKLDVEGVEFDLLAGIIEHGLHHRIRHILVETHERHIEKLAAKGAEIRSRIKEMDIRNIDLGWV
jgi:FkbM family methyltransferase